MSKIWFLPLTEIDTLKVSEDIVLGKIFGPKTNEVT
jgi:hypothetical protein